MIKSAGGPRLLLEALQATRIGGERGRKNLDCNLATQLLFCQQRENLRYGKTCISRRRVDFFTG
jgi:hypothetical protein